MINFGKRIEPLTDKYLIEEMKNCSFSVSEPHCIAKALSFDQPWENKGTVKLYYRGYPFDEKGDGSEDQVAALATSADGVHFKREKINKIPYHTIKENNIIMKGSECHMFVPFLDKNPNANPNEKYKAVAGYWSKGLYAYGSADGIIWHKLKDNYIITDGRFDSVNVPLWDPNAEVYRCYSRFVQRNEHDGIWYRAIQSCTSKDFIHWTTPVRNEYSDIDMDKYCEHLYTNAATPIPGAEHMFFYSYAFLSGKEKNNC